MSNANDLYHQCDSVFRLIKDTEKVFTTKTKTGYVYIYCSESQ